MLEDRIRNRLLVHNGRVIYNCGIVDKNRRGQVTLTDDYRPETLHFDLDKLVLVLEAPIDPRYEEIRKKYQEGLEELYEKVRRGKIKNWGELKTAGLNFFCWDVNTRGVIRYITEHYLLKDLGCELADLPLEGGLRKKLREHGIDLSKRFKSFREMFVVAYPEMSDHPGWHASRWFLKREKRWPISKYRRDYLFRHRLGCKTKEDVINALDHESLMNLALQREKVYYKVYNYDEQRRANFYYLIEGLKGKMYKISPWELKCHLPINVFIKPDGGIDRKKVGDYLLWVESKGGSFENGFYSRQVTSVPHYRALLYLDLPATELRKIYNQARRK